MRKLFCIVALMIIIRAGLHAQSNNADKLEIGVGGSFAKPKIIPKLEKLAIAQATVNYKITTEQRTLGQDKGTGVKAGAKVAAYLETTDGDLTEGDFLEVTDYFYTYFQKKLKENGIDTIAWSVVSSSDFYKNGADKEKKEKDEKAGNVWTTSTAHNGNVLYAGAIPFAFGKQKKASSFCEDMGAPAAFFNITVDFADVMINVDINTKNESLYYGTATQKTKYTWAVNPEMKVIPAQAMSLFWNEKTQSESLFLRKEIESGAKYADKVTEDVSKARSGLAKQFAFRKEMTPVVIETTRAKYKQAAKKALEKYADAFVEKVAMLKK